MQMSRPSDSLLHIGPHPSASRDVRPIGSRPSRPMQSSPRRRLLHGMLLGTCGSFLMQGPLPMEKSSCRSGSLPSSNTRLPRAWLWSRLDQPSRMGAEASCVPYEGMCMKTRVPMKGSSGHWMRRSLEPIGRKGSSSLSRLALSQISRGRSAPPLWPLVMRVWSATVRSTRPPPLTQSSVMLVCCPSNSTPTEIPIGSSRRRCP
mmetsp:Transcript_109715/g.353912  ORF Transcript_109715/g.353912 Transcript_109715/m.353912 type:complete len:204 (-) Transcript_109715:318-929(-)